MFEFHEVSKLGFRWHKSFERCPLLRKRKSKIGTKRAFFLRCCGRSYILEVFIVLSYSPMEQKGSYIGSARLPFFDNDHCSWLEQTYKQSRRHERKREGEIGSVLRLVPARLFMREKSKNVYGISVIGAGCSICFFNFLPSFLAVEEP